MSHMIVRQYFVYQCSQLYIANCTHFLLTFLFSSKDVDTTVLTKTVLVECGIFNRPVVFNSTANGVGDKSSLISAITQTFPGLQQEYIALLKVRSTQYGGYYIDMMDSDKSIESHSYIKVVIFSKVRITIDLQVSACSTHNQGLLASCMLPSNN